MQRLSQCFTDYRKPELIEHSVKELLLQRIYGLALGYEDLNDHDQLRHDPLLAIAVGMQKGRFYHGYYRHYCYFPLYIFSGDHLLCARLRQSDIDGAAGVVEELDRIVKHIRLRWPKVKIWIRGDSGFCREKLMSWCESNKCRYVLV